MRFALQTAARPALSLPRAFPSSSRKITIPAPELAPKEGETTNFVVRCDNVIDNPATALRLVRAVEKELGPVIRIDMPKDQDMRRGYKFMSVQTLRPASLPEPIKGELGASYVDQNADQGGVSMTDIMEALGSAQRSPRSTKPVRRLQYQINERQGPVRSFGRQSQGQGQGRRAPRPTMAQQREDSQIVAALRQLDGGFFGGFAGLADKFKELEMPAAAEPPVNAPRVKKADKAKREAAEASSASADAEAPQPPVKEEPKETGPRKTFAEIVAEQREAKLAAIAEAQAKAQADKPQETEEVREESTEGEDAAAAEAAKKEKLAQMALKRAKRTAAAQAKAEAHRAEIQAARDAEEKRLQEIREKEEEEQKKKKRGWF
ncbi:hypothetical protein A1Q2_04188 [Trichosporon asahii var. asahii CBS 8904]|uniref:Uncharacterized protein n=1 Tax=Trichosporon asahii var. asahii (strain CBS 8904) TaxID=1220162 RepID=K1VQG8_TRIAC|nr:hypothetical protein A1Q2_04188 [Trichosporon asahii var. asahii CBS 8904]